MHKLSSSFVLAYHGCQQNVGERLLAGDAFALSENDYDWLGPGIYFWESNPKRALEWADLIHERKRISAPSHPFVVGAVIDLGFCLDLLSSNGLRAVSFAHEELLADIALSNGDIPQNTGGNDLFLRRLDCAVIRHLHQIRLRNNQPAFDTVRGVFVEGTPIYPTSGFREKTHIQIGVSNPGAIKGVFRVSSKELE